MATLLLLPGDGIGPEVIDQVKRVAARLTPDLALEERPFGGVAFDTQGTPLHDDTLALAKRCGRRADGRGGRTAMGEARRVICGRKPDCSACARALASSPICGPRCALPRWRTPPP